MAKSIGTCSGRRDRPYVWSGERSSRKSDPQRWLEDGVYTSGSNTQVPVDWVSNPAFDSEPGFNHVTMGSVHSGDFPLEIGNFDADPLATLTQTFNDFAGDTYTVSFWAFDNGANPDSNAFLTVSVGSQSKTFDDTVATYTEGTFTFVGTGSDTISIAAKTNPAEWFVDDMSVTGSAVPDPSTWAMLLLGFAGLGYAGYRQRQRLATAAGARGPLGRLGDRRSALKGPYLRQSALALDRKPG